MPFFRARGSGLPHQPTAGKRRRLVTESQASQDADLAGSGFGGFVVSADSIEGFGSATAPIREPFLNWFR